jgi:hypothetical protein
MFNSGNRGESSASLEGKEIDLLRRRRVEGRIRHAKTGAEMLGEQLDGFAISLGIGLGQVLHGFHEQALALDVARIGFASALATARVGTDRNRKYFRHVYSVLLEDRPVELGHTGISKVYRSFYPASKDLYVTYGRAVMRAVWIKSRLG